MNRKALKDTNKLIDFIDNERGQTLLFVVVALTVALAIGISVSTRTISSVRRSTSTDTSSRVYSAAEGGIEWFLRQSEDTLSSLSDGDNSSGTECPTGTTDYEGDDKSCFITYVAADNDNITSRAIVDVSTFTFNNPVGTTPNYYWFYLNSGEVKEVRIDGYMQNLRICWTGQDASVLPDLYYYYYADNPAHSPRKGILRNMNGTHTADEGASAGLVINAVNTPYPLLDFVNCATISIPSQQYYGLRLKSMYGPAKVGIFDISGSHDLPAQGYIINSTGELYENQTIKTVKKLKVFRSYTYMPALFDYAIYSNSPLGITP